MKVFLAVVLLTYAVVGVPSSDEKATILRQQQDSDPDGNYQFTYETQNGISAQQEGKVVDKSQNVQGSFGYTAPDGTPVELSFVADEKGYQPKSDILPTTPPVPWYVALALEYNARHPDYD